MNLDRIVMLLTCLILINSCNVSVIKSNLKNDLENIIVISQCDGVYEYSGKKLKKELKFKIESSDIYIENPFDYENDEIIIGFRYKDQEVDSISYYSKYYGLDKKVRRIIKYIKLEKSKVVIEKENFRNGKVKVDTFINCTGMNSSTRYLKYNCISKEEDIERFYRENLSKSGDKVFSRKGNIYLKTPEGTKQITDFEGNFDSKFGNGFYDPSFIKKDKSILYSKLPGFLSENKHVLYEYDIEKQKTIKFLEGTFLNRKVSENGQYMLFSRSNIFIHFVDSDCRNHTIFLMNLKTKEFNRIGRGSYFEWKKSYWP